MKKIIALLLCFGFLLSGSANVAAISKSDQGKKSDVVHDQKVPDDFRSEEFHTRLESELYRDLIKDLNSEEVFVDSVDSIYESEETVLEREYNSQENIYFGKKLSELEQMYKGDKYTFTLGSDGQTTTERVDDSFDETYRKAAKNVCVSAGIIAVTVTFAFVANAVGAPAISVVVLAGAKEAATYGTLLASLTAIATFALEAYKTGNVEQALKQAALVGSEAFKFNTILMTVGGSAKKYLSLYKCTLNGLTMNEVVLIQKEGLYPLDVIKNFKSIAEYNKYKESGLYAAMVNNKTCLIRDINLKYKSKDGWRRITNLQRMKKGKAPYDPVSKKPYELHHVNQDPNGTLAILTSKEHNQFSSILHKTGDASKINRKTFDKERKKFWKDLAYRFENDLIAAA